MSDIFSSSFDDLDPTQTSKCAQDLSTYIDNKFPTQPPSLSTILNEYPYLNKLGHLTMNLLRSLVGNGLTDESFGKVDFAVRTLIFEKCNNDISNLRSQMSLNSIRSMTGSSIDSASSSPFTIKTEAAQEIRRLNEELQNSKTRELHLEDEIKSQKNIIEQHEEEKLQLKSQLLNNQSQTNGQYINMQVEIMNLKDEIDRQKENVSFSENREKRLNGIIAELNQDKESLDKKIADLNAVIQNKKEKISTLKLNEKKLKYEIQNERLNSSKLQAELEMQLKLQNEKAGQNGSSQKLVDLVDRYQKILNERDVDNAFLSQKLTSISNYAQQLVTISEELEDRLSMAEEDKEVNISLINQLKNKINALAKENQDKQDELISTQNELQALKDLISKFEKETGISIENADIHAILASRDTNLADSPNSPEKFVELEKIITSILRYLDLLMTGNGDVYPLICRSEPILESQEIRRSIISSIEDLKVTLSLTSDVTDVPTILDKILADDESIRNVIKELENKREYTEYAAICVLCSANSNVRQFLEKTAESLTEMHKLLPIEYRKSDIVESISSYLKDSQNLFGHIFEAMNNNTLFRSDEVLFYPMMKSFIEQTSEVLHNLDVEVKPTIRFRGKLVDMPNEIANYIEAQERLIETLKSNGDNTYLTDGSGSSPFALKSRDIKFDDQITQLEDEKSNLLQKIDTQTKKHMDEIEELTQKLNEEISKRKLAEQNLELTQKGAAESMAKAKIVEKERDDLLELSNKRKKLFAERKQAIIENEKLNFEEQLRRERKKFETEKQAIIQTLEAKNSRYKSLKRRYAEMEAMYEKQSSYQSSKIVELINNIRIIGEKTTSQAEEREKRHEAEVKRLEDKVARILSLADSNKNGNDENTEMMDTSIIDSEKIPSTAINKSNAPSALYLTPNKSGIEALNLSENIIDDLNNSARLVVSRNSDCDRFVAQVGRALSKYTKDEGPWTRSRILSSIPRLFARLAEIEKCKSINNFESTTTQPYNTPQDTSTLTPSVNRNRSMSLTISKTTPNRFTSTNENINSDFDLSSNLLNSSTINDSVSSASKPPLKIAAALNEQRDWQSWAIDIALRLNISPRSPVELRTELRDIIFASNAKSQLVKMISSLREQKKLLKNFQLQILFPFSSEESSLNKKNLKLRSIVLCLRFAMIEKRLASKAALNQQHMKNQVKNSPRYSLQLSPRTNQTQL